LIENLNSEIIIISILSPQALEVMVEVLGQRAWVSLKSPLYIEVLSETLIPDVFAVTCSYHSILIFGLELPDFFLVDIIDLFFCGHSIPEKERVHSVIILAYIILGPNLIDAVCPDTHSPHVLAVLDVQVLRKLCPWGV